MPQHKPVRREDLVFEELDGEAVLYDPRCGAVHRFDALTMFVWQACDGTHSTADISRAVTEAYDVDPQAALGHVERLIGDFCMRDLLAQGCTATAKVPAEATEGTTARAPIKRAGAATATGQPDGMGAPLPRGVSRGGLPSRRAVLRGGATKLAFAAPVISTFFARPAYGSNPIHPALSAFGDEGCKNVGYSCTAPGDCCGFKPGKLDCQGNTCCVLHGETKCYRDEDCCDYPADFCTAQNRCE